MGVADFRAIAERHGLPADAVETLAAAIRRGGGRQAQFSHPALGGMGQWSRGGGIMIGDMFDHALKAKVARACDDLAEHVAADDEGPDDSDWWPRSLGRPSSVGSQNAQGYAFFPEARRLAIRDRDGVRLYDTKDHRIAGVSQQQSNGTGVPSFQSQHGPVRLDELSPVDATREERSEASPPERPSLSTGDDRASNDVLVTIERLHELRRKDVLTETEFAEKKKELLARL